MRLMTVSGRGGATAIRKFVPAALLVAGLSACSPATEESASTVAAAANPAGNFDFEGWDQYLGGADSSQYSSLAQVNKSNVGQLEVAWTFPTGDTLVAGSLEFVL